jgi:nitroreductase
MDLKGPQHSVELSATPDAATALDTAALVALQAPSVHNTQPWHWQVSIDRIELYADERWRLKVADPDGRLLVLSCGAALHHARVALRAMRYQPAVHRFPDPHQPHLLARVTVDRPIPESERTQELMRAALSRQTDRRPFTDSPLPEPVAAALRQAANSEGVWLHLLNLEQTRVLLAAAERAENVEFAEPGYRRELAAWTGRPDGATEGVPSTALPPRGNGHQTTGSYAALYGSGDRPASWLRAGEALSTVWLNAIAHGLAIQPVSSVIEVPAARAVLHRMLSGIGSPYLVLRIGIPATDTTTGLTPRGAAHESVQVDSPADEAAVAAMEVQA